MNDMVEYFKAQVLEADDKVSEAMAAYEEAGRALKDQLPELLDNEDFSGIDRLTNAARRACTELDSARRADENARIAWEAAKNA